MKQASILIIDDNRDLTDGLGMVLEDEGYQVTLTYDGKQGLAAFADGHFDLVILDIKLPDVNGLEIFQRIHESNPAVDVIIITGYRVEQLLSETAGSGEVKIFRTSVSVAKVTETLRQMAGQGIVLIADDGPEFALHLAENLDAQGVATWHGGDCRKAVSESISSPVEVLILDGRMPVICGLGAHWALRQQGCAAKTVIVMGRQDPESAAADVLRSATATGCLFKPFDPEEMLAIIERSLKKQT